MIDTKAPLTINVVLTGGGSATARVRHESSEFRRLGGVSAVERLLRNAGLGFGAWRLRVLKSFERSTVYDQFTNFAVAGPHVQFRYKPRGDHGFVVAVTPDKAHGVSPAALKGRLEEAALPINEARAAQRRRHEEALDSEVGEEALVRLVDAVGRLDSGEYEDTELFFADVLREIGPDQNRRRAFWQRAVRLAEDRGLIRRNCTGYVVGRQEPPTGGPCVAVPVRLSGPTCVVPVDGSPEALETAQRAATQLGLSVDASPEALAEAARRAELAGMAAASRPAAATPAAAVAESVEDAVSILARSPDLPLLLSELADLGVRRQRLTDRIAADRQELDLVNDQIKILIGTIDTGVLLSVAAGLDKEKV